MKLVSTLAALLATVQVASAETYPSGQGWSASSAADWYELSQGSRMIPLKWFERIKRPDGSYFATRQSFEDYGFLYFPNMEDRLPVGFVEDIDESGQSYLGLNCAACHTSKISANGHTVFVHGGSTMSNFQRFTDDVIEAVGRELESEEKTLAFASQLLGKAPNLAELEQVSTELKAWLDLRQTIHGTGDGSHWGVGRSDAVGIILATVATVVADPEKQAVSRKPLPESNAPVSYPFAWNANQQARLQHNGVVDNGSNFGLLKDAKIGALIRNWTEAFGVFGASEWSDDGETLNTTIRLDNLLKIEQALADLQSPQWPQEFGAIDVAKAARGKALYRDNCLKCHGILDGHDTTTELPLAEKPGTAASPGFIYLQPLFAADARPEDFAKDIHPDKETIGTDPGMACNAMTHVSPSGRLQGKMNKIGIRNEKTDRPFGPEAVSTDLLRGLIQRDVLAHKTDTVLTLAQNQAEALGEIIVGWFYQPTVDEYTGQGTSGDPLELLRGRIQNCVAAMRLARAIDPNAPLPVYKARPLNGIWATAPFLHNGSVPTLDDLLKPQAERPVRFGIKDGELDVVKLGLKDQLGVAGADVFDVYEDDGNVVTGNWNGGHEYGTGLNATERFDLIEYVKGL